jgi:hypothetical protein
MQFRLVFWVFQAGMRGAEMKQANSFDRAFTRTSLETIYVDGEYLKRNPSLHVQESPWKARQILRMLRRNHIVPKTVCEVGCGAGEVLRQLQKSMEPECVFCGYEISPQAYDMCQSRANDRLKFKLADIMEARDAFFDLILVLDVIEHLEDYFSFLRGIRSKSQYKIFHFPLDLCAQTVLRKNGLIKRRNLYSHLHYFTKETALRTLQDIGYEVLDSFYTPRAIELGDGLGQKILKLPRKLGFAINRDFTARVLGGFGLLVCVR